MSQVWRPHEGAMTPWDGLLSSEHPVASAIRWLAAREASAVTGQLEQQCTQWVTQQLRASSAQVSSLVAEAQRAAAAGNLNLQVQLQQVASSAATATHQAETRLLDTVGQVAAASAGALESTVAAIHASLRQLHSTVAALRVDGSRTAHQTEVLVSDVGRLVAELTNLVPRVSDIEKTQSGQARSITNLAADLAKAHASLAALDGLPDEAIVTIEKLEDLQQARLDHERALKRIEERIARRATKESLARVETQATSSLTHVDGRLHQQQQQITELQAELARAVVAATAASEQVKALQAQLASSSNPQQLQMQQALAARVAELERAHPIGQVPPATQGRVFSPSPLPGAHVDPTIGALQQQLAQQQVLIDKLLSTTPKGDTEAPGMSYATDEEDEESCRTALAHWRALERRLDHSEIATGAFVATNLTRQDFIGEWRRRLRIRATSNDFHHTLVEDMITRLAAAFDVASTPWGQSNPVPEYAARKNLRLALEAAARLNLQLHGVKKEAFDDFAIKVRGARTKNRTSKSVFTGLDTLVADLAVKFKQTPNQRSGSRGGRRRGKSSSNRGDREGRDQKERSSRRGSRSRDKQTKHQEKNDESDE
jgi:hypothetical protein